MTGGGLVSRFIAFGISIFLARVVGAAGLGALGSAFALIVFFQNIVNAGLDPYAIRDTARHHKELPSIYAKIVGTRILLVVVSSLLILASLFVLPDRLTRHSDLIVIYGLMIVTDAVTTEWALRGLERMKLVAWGLVVQHLIMAAGIFLFLPFHVTSLWIVPAAHVISLVTMQTWFYLALRRQFSRLRPTFDWRQAMELVRESLPVALGKILRLFYYQGDVLLLAIIANEVSAGEFFASQRIILVGAMVGIYYQLNNFPTTSRLGEHDPARAARFQSDAFRYAVVVLTPAIIGGAWFADPIILLVFGNEFTASAKILSVMLFSLPFFIFNLGLQNLILVAKLGRHVVIGNGVAASSHIALAVLLVPWLSGLGAAWASLVGEILGAVYMGMIVWKKLRSRPLQTRLLAPVAAGGAMAGTLWATQGLAIFLQVGLSIMAYGVIAYLLGALCNSEMKFVRRFVWNLARRS